MNLSRIAAFVVLLAGLVLAGEKGFNPPPLSPASTYPAHEAHTDEKVAIAIDPFDTEAKVAIFKIKYKDYDLLPIRLIISNDSDRPLMLDHVRIELITAHKEKLSPAVRDDILRKLARPEKVTSRPKVRLPIPGTHDNKPISREAREEVETAMFINVPVSPHSTNGGFLFFDVNGIENPEAQAHLYITGIKAGTQELFYFDIPLEDYLNRSAQGKPAAN